MGIDQVAFLPRHSHGRRWRMPGDLFQTSPGASSRPGADFRRSPKIMSGQFPTREAIEAQQLAQLRQLLDAILPGNAFYREKFAGLNTAISSLNDFRKRFPFTLKNELVSDQLRTPPFGTNLTFPADRYTRFHQTSGTTSVPLRWL